MPNTIGTESKDLVVDTNVVFSALIAGGKTRELIITGHADLYAPEFFYTELEDHREEVSAKTGLSERDLSVLLNLLFEHIQIVFREEFAHALPDARHHIADIDPDDIPFLALALHLDAGLWTDDSHFQQQDAVPVWRTHELVDRLSDE